MGNIDAATTNAILLVAVAGAVAGLVGGLLASSRASITGSILMGAIGGITFATIFKILDIDPIVSAGAGFSYLYAAGGGLLLGLVVTASNK
jgi:ammonia channel protein AmtB